MIFNALFHGTFLGLFIVFMSIGNSYEHEFLGRLLIGYAGGAAGVAVVENLIALGRE